jgi:hypothetical protein
MNSANIHDNICPLIHKQCHPKGYHTDIKYHMTLNITVTILIQSNPECFQVQPVTCCELSGFLHQFEVCSIDSSRIMRNCSKVLTSTGYFSNFTGSSVITLFCLISAGYHLELHVAFNSLPPLLFFNTNYHILQCAY